MPPAVDKINAGPNDEIAYRARHENLAWTSERGDTRADVDRDPSQVITAPLTLAGVETGSDFESNITAARSDRLGTCDGSAWPIERGQKSVTRGLNFLASETLELVPNRHVMLVEQGTPLAIAEHRRMLS